MWGPGPSLHTRWTTLGAERHVDLWMKRCAVHSDRPPETESSGGIPGTTEAPVPGGDRGLSRHGKRYVRFGAGNVGIASHAWVGRGFQRQRIDMIRPATIAPNPMAKFQASSVTMNGIWSPAT